MRVGADDTVTRSAAMSGPSAADEWPNVARVCPLATEVPRSDDESTTSRNGSVMPPDGPTAVVPKLPELSTRRTGARSPMSAPRLQRPQAASRRHAAVRPQRSTRPTVVTLVVVAAVLVIFTVTMIMTLTEKLGDNVPRVPDAFEGLDATARPPATGGETFLLVGTDTRSGVPTTGTNARALAPGDHGDVLMMARLAEDGQSAAVVSIPRDSWVSIPGYGMDKINAACAFGGPSLLINTVENLTTLHIDHFAVVDFAASRSVVDSVGGIDVGISHATSNAGVNCQQGVNHLDGVEALAYVGQRYGLADGDLDRAQCQQNALCALLDKVASTGTLNDPVGLYRLLRSAGQFVSVDGTLSNGGLRALMQKLRNLPPDHVSFLRAPVSGLGREPSESVVYLDAPRAPQLWDSVQSGSADTYAEQNANDALGPVTR